MSEEWKMMKKYDVAALGELLIDFVEAGESPVHNPLFEACPGGAPCNVLAMLQRLGKKTAFIGKVGNDALGNMLAADVKALGIDTRGLIRDSQVHTTLAFVHKLPNNDRDFSFYRNPGADMMLTPDELNMEILGSTKIFHFGTLSMTHDNVRQATIRAIDAAKKAGALISFDPNLREPLWSSLELAKEQVWYGIGCCDILKISDNEIRWLTGEDDFTAGVAKIRERRDISLILVSEGRDGSRAYYHGRMVKAHPFINPDTIETTGAGDTFCANILGYVLDHDFETLTDAQLEEMLLFANAAASIVTTRKGALKVMPERGEIQDFIKNYR